MEQKIEVQEHVYESKQIFWKLVSQFRWYYPPVKIIHSI